MPARLALALVLAAASGVGAGGSASAQPGWERAYSVRVCARLRPLPPDEASATGAQQRKPVVLPLHQRLQLLRASQRCNQTDAQRRLWESRGAPRLSQGHPAGAWPPVFAHWMRRT